MKPIKLLLLAFLLFPLSASFAVEKKPFSDFDGKPIAVEDFFPAEKWTVLMIWRHDCHVCNQEVAAYSFFHEDNEQIQVIGLSTDGMAKKDKAQQFIANHDLSFNNIIGELGVVMRYYLNKTGSRFLGTPTFLVFSPEGKLMAAQAGAISPDVISNFVNKQSD